MWVRNVTATRATAGALSAKAALGRASHVPMTPPKITMVPITAGATANRRRRRPRSQTAHDVMNFLDPPRGNRRAVEESKTGHDSWDTDSHRPLTLDQQEVTSKVRGRTPPAPTPRTLPSSRRPGRPAAVERRGFCPLRRQAREARLFWLLSSVPLRSWSGRFVRAFRAPVASSPSCACRKSIQPGHHATRRYS